jgi:hypothetical protein
MSMFGGLGSVIYVGKEHFQHGVEVAGPPVAARLIDLLLIDETTNQRHENVHMVWIGDARRSQLGDSEGHQFLGVRVRGGTWFESGNGSFEQQEALNWMINNEFQKSQAPVTYRLPWVDGIVPRLHVIK